MDGGYAPVLAVTFAVSLPTVAVTIAVFAAILPAPPKTTSKGSKVSTSLLISSICFCVGSLSAFAPVTPAKCLIPEGMSSNKNTSAPGDALRELLRLLSADWSRPKRYQI
jgi:hypothetical protein